MTTRLASQLARLLIVTMMIAAWFVASDHCALASMLQRTVAAAPAEESCPGHSSQPEKKPSQGEAPCCKSLVATPAPVKISAGFDLSLFVLQPFLAVDFQLVPGNTRTLPDELDTGPPEIRTFAESVLQRSLLAHAPPVLA